ncbi:MAG: cupredoxin domain-containing protein [Rhodospirillales bacterium]|nr:cupredoxin domain-containing protein [Rhodospirillales bacterium]
MRRAVLAAALILLAAPPARAARPEFTLALGPAGFTPPELRVPAGERIVLRIRNTGPAPVEFESSDLNRERVIPAGGAIVVYAGPLHPGTYAFFDDFHPTLRGRLIAEGPAR